jgi:hypothetical protein
MVSLPSCGRTSYIKFQGRNTEREEIIVRQKYLSGKISPEDGMPKRR